MFRRLLFPSDKTYRAFSTLPSSTNLYLTIKQLMDTKQYQKALDHFQQHSEQRTDALITLALKACTKLRDYERGTKIQQQLSPRSLRNHYIQTSLIHFYMQCHDFDTASRLFSSITKRPNAMYGAMFKGFISNAMPEKVLDLLDETTLEPDSFHLTFIFDACSQLNNDRARRFGNKSLDEMPKHFRKNNFIMNSAIHMLMKFGDIIGAERIFKELEKKDFVSYGAMMKGYVDNDMNEKALDIFEVMPLKPNDIIYCIIFSACAQLNNDRARRFVKTILDEMPKHFRKNNFIMSSAIHMLMKFGDIMGAERMFEVTEKKNSITYGTMMNGYTINDEPLKCFQLFEQTKHKNIVLDGSGYNSLIGTCSQTGMRSRCDSIVAQIPLHLYDNPQITNSLINMWGKVGSVKDAQRLFESISSPTVYTYSSMINTFGLNGMGFEAVDLYRKIPVELRNEVSHVCVLNACSHSGLIDSAHSIFNNISNKTERIVTTMIDCLSRLFMFDEAQKLMKDYEKTNPPYIPMYMAILSGARNCRNLDVSQKVYTRMKSLFPDEKTSLISGSILLCNIHSSLGDHQQAGDVRLSRKRELGNKVKAGLSWTEVNGELVSFKAHDRSHPRSKEIYAELERLSAELVEHGHNYEDSWITRPIDDDETVASVLCGHSEKLAIAFNFIQQSKPTSIQIAGNLRVCGDCHAATKLVAKIRQCEIVIRDANRIHHFSTTGQCSCQDHF